MLRFQHQGYQMKALLKVDEEYQISDIYSLDFTIFSSKIKNFLPLSRQTNDKFGIFSNFFKFFQFFLKNEMDWGSKIKEFFFFPPLSTFKLIEKQLFPSCLSSKRTIILVIFFQIFKAYLGKKKVDLDLLEITTQNLTFFSQFVKIFKVSSLAIFQVFMVFYHKI